MEYYIPQLADLCSPPGGLYNLDDAEITSCLLRPLTIHSVLRNLSADNPVHIWNEPKGTAQRGRWYETGGHWLEDFHISMLAAGITSEYIQKA